MKTQELNLSEMKEINGGSIFGSGNDSQTDSGLFGSLGIDNLLSYSNESHDGDEHTQSSGSLGNGINLDLGGIFRSISE